MRARTIGAVVAGTALVAAAGLGAMAMEYARQLTSRAKHPERPSRIVDFDGATITIERYLEADRTGRFGLWFDDDRGYARLGGVVRADRHTVTRRVERLELGDPLPGMPCRMASSYWRDPAAAGLAHEDLAVPTALGAMPAWFVPSEDASPWRKVVILVHGWRSNRAEPLRAIPAVRAAGWSSLDISYRNDVGAPSAPDGRYHLGATEWRDVEAAIRFALDRGAERIVLGGWSMGGGTVLQTVLRSELADRVERVLLDSPALDWRSILAAYVRLAGLPAPIAPMAAAIIAGGVSSWLVGLGEPIPVAELRALGFADRLGVPILLIQGDADPTTPVGPARAFAAARPDLIEYVEFPGAGHVRNWNADRDRYDTAVTDWLRSAE